jgi:DNA topoisomerase-1
MKLVIVESPTKAKTISKFLGSNYVVESSFGHVRDLPKSKLGVDVEHNFEPDYTVPAKAKDHVKKLKSLVDKADEVVLATDEDREGEAIAWHLLSALKITKPISRIVFHEITKSAIEEALAHPRQIDEHLVNAQQARRILDRLVGYKLSPLLWSKVRRGLSAGRVQSVAVRMIVERERERLAFKSDEYWSVEGKAEKDQTEFDVKLVERNGKKLDKLAITTGDEANTIVEEIKKAKTTVASVQKTRATRKPPVPLKTSALQQEANNSLGFSAKQTMTLAQKLYETGRITYMRTDSINLAEKFLNETQSYLVQSYGNEYATGAVRYKTNAKGAQEAHEGIRPTDVNVTPESLKTELDPGMYKLYKLIWSRTLASQMPAATLERTAVDIKADNNVLRANGSTIVFDGFMKVYKSSQEKILPVLVEGDAVSVKEIAALQHFTEPAARYSDATLVKALEEYGIGRPSTYAPTISTIIDRGYVDRDDNKKLFPTDTAMIVTDMLVNHFSDIVNYEFTATMENTLDEVAEGKVEWVPMLRAFYGPFIRNVEAKSDDLKREDVVPERNLGKDPATGKDVIIKTGRFGPYVQLGEWEEEDRKAKQNRPKSVSLLKGMTMEGVSMAEALELLKLPRELGKTAEGEPITVQIGPYGPYMKAGKISVSLPEGFSPLTITADQVEEVFTKAAEIKKKLAEPIAELGIDPNSQGNIVVKNGRFGPYITDGKTNVTVPKKTDPKDVTREDAIEMLEKKRHAPKRAWGGRGKKAEPKVAKPKGKGRKKKVDAEAPATE